MEISSLNHICVGLGCTVRTPCPGRKFLKNFNSRIYYQLNRSKVRQRHRAYAKASPRRNRVTYEEQRTYYLKYKYNLTREKYDQMVKAQNYVCYICNLPPLGTTKQSSALHVDHCHKTGVVRKLLCSACNTTLGKYKESEQIFMSFVEYIIQSKRGWQK